MQFKAALKKQTRQLNPGLAPPSIPTPHKYIHRYIYMYLQNHRDVYDCRRSTLLD